MAPNSARTSKGSPIDGSAGLDQIPSVTEDQDRRYYAITIRPQVFVNLVPDHVIIHRMFPLAADHTIVECDWLYLPAVVDSGKDVSHSVELFHRVNQQDFAACERCQPAMSSRTYRDGGVLVPSRTSHRRIPRLAAGQADQMTTVLSVEVAHPMTDRRCGGDHIGDHLAQALVR